MEAPSSLSIPLSVTPTQSLLEDDEIRDHLIAMDSEAGSPEELELLSLIHTNPPVSNNLEDTEECSQNTIAQSADDDGQPATTAGEITMPNEMSVPAPGTSRPIFPWLPEAGYLVVAVSALTATVLVLAKFDKQEQPHWPYADVFNLSALIAILATLLRSMVTLILEALIGQLKWYWYGRARPVAHVQVFDEASRGAWGSSKLLYRIHGADWPSVSAIFMVLSIGIGTFTQLALRTTACPKAVPHAVASIPTAHSIFTHPVEFGPYTWGTRFETILNTFMSTATLNGISGLQSLAAVSASCDTGNCSFTTYHNITHSTLGIESMCLDFSPFLNQTENSTISFTTPFRSETYVSTNYTGRRGYPSISYLVEGDFENGSFTSHGRWYPLFNLKFRDLTPSPATSDNMENREYVEKSDDISDQEELLIQRSFYQQTFIIPTLNPCLERSAYPPTVDPLPLINTSSCPQLGMTNVSSFPGYFSLAAVECYIYPSIRYYAGSIVNGQIQETLIGQPVPLDLGSNATGGETDIESLYNLEYFAFSDPCIIEGTVYTSANMSQAHGDRITIHHLIDGEITGPKLCLYGVSIGSMSALEILLQTIVFKDTDHADIESSSCEPNVDYTEVRCPSAWWLEPLFNGGNASFDSINAAMSRMADAMTNQLRMNGTDWYGNPSNVTGTAFQTVVCTQFQWGWLLFPAGVVLASAVLLAATAWKSGSRWARGRRDRGGPQGLPVWKSSLLPLLFYGLEDGARLKGPPAEDKEMAGLAGEMVARFSFEKDELRLQSAKPTPRE